VGLGSRVDVDDANGLPGLADRWKSMEIRLDLPNAGWPVMRRRRRAGPPDEVRHQEYAKQGPEFSTSVIARASAVVSPARTPAASRLPREFAGAALDFSGTMEEGAWASRKSIAQRSRRDSTCSSQQVCLSI